MGPGQAALLAGRTNLTGALVVTGPSAAGPAAIVVSGPTGSLEDPEVSISGSVWGVNLTVNLRQLVALAGLAALLLFALGCCCGAAVVARCAPQTDVPVPRQPTSPGLSPRPLREGPAKKPKQV